MTLHRYKVIIIGGGPAGLATALHIAQQSPELAPEMLIIEAQEHPRFKLCGGGVTFHGEQQLEKMGVQVDARAFVADRLIFRLGERDFVVNHENAMRIFERSAFDAALAQAVKQRGLCLHTNEKLVDLRVVDDGVEITTNHSHYYTKVLVGADGANSTVRRKLKLFSTLGVARLLRIMTPCNPDEEMTWQENTAIFDFSCVQRGVQGYMWDFPCYVGDKAFMNRGIMDSRITAEPVDQRTNLKQAFADGLSERNINLEDAPLKGHPVRWFNPQAEFARPHVLLTGDAAGVDPLFAEGISYAMEYGGVAAGMIHDAFNSGDFSFSDYRRRVVNHRLGHLLRRRAAAARYLYEYRYPPAWGVFWWLASIAPKPIQQKFGAAMALLPP